MEISTEKKGESLKALRTKALQEISKWMEY